MKFRKKPVVIEAFCLGVDKMPDWFVAARDCGGVATRNVGGRWHGSPGHAVIKTLEGNMRAEFGDYVIKGISGELYPCKPDIFAATYEAAE